MKIGVGYRRELAEWISTKPPLIGCLEITAEHFFNRPLDLLPKLSEVFSTSVHGLGLSLGTPGALDRDRLAQFARVARAANAEWVSEHISFTRAGGLDLGHLNPVPRTREMISILGDHALEVASECQKPVLLENITSHLQLPGDFSEPDFLNRLCEHADCGLLLDVTNLFVNSRNHRFDPLKWLREIDAKRIRQLHIVGYARAGDRFTDSHSQPIQSELIELTQTLLEYASVESIILERDDAFPDSGELESELAKLHSLHACR
jgi:hypothetical protein